MQHDKKDCGPACLQQIAKSYGRHFKLNTLRGMCNISREGVSLYGIGKVAEKIGFKTYGVKFSFEKLCQSQLPCIAHWNRNHFIVVEKIKKNKVYVYDPAFGGVKYSTGEFLNGWTVSDDKNAGKGICLLLEPTKKLKEAKDEPSGVSVRKQIYHHVIGFRRFSWQLISGILVAIIIQLIIPFLTQTIVDLGINNQNISFIKIALIALLVLGLAQLLVEFIRNQILLHVNSRINIGIISEFLGKVMHLPISFFDTLHIGDLLQRVGDQSRIEKFLTVTFVSAVYFMMNVLVFSLVLLFYNYQIFLVFLTGFALSVVWIWYFMRRRKELDFKRFEQKSENHSSIVQMFNGINDIRLFNISRQKRWEWEELQAKIFQTNISGLAIDQYQRFGAMLINQIKNLLIIFIVAQSVIQGSMTLGMMMAIVFILGQLNAPVNQLASMFRSCQDAKLSMERLDDVMSMENDMHTSEKLPFLPDDKSITFKGVSFCYNPTEGPEILNNINLHIPENKVTAIVGLSGCGKSTLLKLMLGLYKPQKGKISAGNISLNSIDPELWNSNCSAVMQDGFLFSDTILNNIIMHDEDPDYNRLIESVEMACIKDHIESLPLNYQTVVGQNGRGLSSGQKQRLLIARALYKKSDFLFLDEATNALDATNEKSILDNIKPLLQNKTVVVIAHRLSTIKNADQIVVLDKGRIVEVGSHFELMSNELDYYNLIKNQTQLIYENN